MSEPVFTDSGIKNLEMQIDYCRTSEDLIPSRRWELEALLHRLECAEAYINSMPKDVTDENCRLHKAWRKASGKQEAGG